MKKTSSIRVNERGIAHVVLGLLIFTVFGFIGITYITLSHAQATSSSSRSASIAATPKQNFGLSIHIRGQGANKANYVASAKAANATTVRDDFGWHRVEATKGTFDWSGPDEIVRLSAQNGLRVLAIADYTPTWASSCPTAADPSKCAPVNASDYGNFVGALVARYKQGGSFWSANPSLTYMPLSGVEIWNEPNVGNFWQKPDGAKYALVVKAGYKAAKAADPSITVLAGSMTNSTNIAGTNVAPVTFLQQMYAGGAKGYFDALSDHPYVYAANQTATYMLAKRDTSAWSQMASTSPSLRSVMSSNGDGAKKIWITEFGAPTAGTNAVSELEQSRLATQAVAKWKSYSWAGNLYWYTLHDDCVSTTDKECNFGILHNDNTQKPAYGTLKAAFTP